MWDLDDKEGWVPKNFWYGIVVVEKTPENPLDWQEIQLVNPKRNQHWICIGRADTKRKSSILTRELILWKKILVMGKIESRRGWQRMRWLNGIISSMDMSLSKLQEIVKDREALHAAVYGIINSWTWLSNWTATHFHTWLWKNHNFDFMDVCWQSDISAFKYPV